MTTHRPITDVDITQIVSDASPWHGLPFKPVPVAHIHHPEENRGHIVGLIADRRFLVQWSTGSFHEFTEIGLKMYVRLVEELAAAPSVAPVACPHGCPFEGSCFRCMETGLIPT